MPECSPSVEGSPSPSDTKTPLSVASRIPPSPGSPSEISSHHLCSLVFEQGGPSGKVLMIDLSLSSDEENFIADTSHDVKFARKLFGDTTMTSSDRLAMARSSSSMITMKKKRHRRRSLLAPNPWVLLLLSTRPQPPPPTPMMLLWWRKMIIVMIREPN
jgi:hypothetical protein